jgi:glycosyltransferase involved in cell wall biosynthesis
VTLVVVMPAYDAGRHVRGVIERLLAVDARAEALAAPLGLERIIVVDDGSRDDTRQQVLGLPGARVAIELIERARNGGYGAAMKDGIAAAMRRDPDALACVHADGQYGPEALPALLHRMRSHGLDLLQGSRIASGTARSGGMPRYKYAANALLNRIENRTLGLGLSDYHSGYLLYGRRALRRLPFRELSDSFDFDLEAIAAARARGLRVGEAPVPTHYGDEISHLRPIPYGLRVLRVLWKYRRGAYAAT